MGHRPWVTGKHTRTQLLSSFHSAQGSHFFVVDFVVTGILFYCILLYFYCVNYYFKFNERSSGVESVYMCVHMGGWGGGGGENSKSYYAAILSVPHTL